MKKCCLNINYKSHLFLISPIITKTSLSKLKTSLNFRLWIKIIKFDIILEFKQRSFLKRNTDLKRESEKVLNKIKKQNLKNQKLRNNDMFGNFIENLMNKFDAEIVTTRKAILEEVI